jgi:isopentenyl-diphosphate delta-isomerase
MLHLNGRTMEYFEIYDEGGDPTGELEERGVVHARGLWHRTVHVWLYRKGPEILLQKRSAHKDSHPGLWDVSAAGHMNVGENPLSSARRELREELGLEVGPEELRFVEESRRTLTSREGTFIDREITFVYLLDYSDNPAVLEPDGEEVEEVKFFGTALLRSLLGDPVSRTTFVPYDDAYYRSIIRLVEETVPPRGEKKI